MNKYIIGISAYYHDSSVCLFKNGELVFACEEEKFSGVKHDSRFPLLSLEHIYIKYKLKREQIEVVCYYEDPQLKLKRVVDNLKPIWYKKPWFSLKSYLKIKKNIKEVKEELSKISDNVFYSTHHESHLYYSYYTSNFKNATILSIDGVGELDTMSMGLDNGNSLDYHSLSEYPHSLGLFYSAMTSYLGFKPNEGEYKVMGLASYGDSNRFIDKMRELIKYKNSKLTCNMDMFTWDRSDKIMFNEKLIEFLDVYPRTTDNKIESIHQDLAASVQRRYEEVLFDVLKTVSLVSNSTNLCLGGGCAYNGTANGKIVNNSDFKNLWIPVAPSDAGSAVGACINYLVNHKKLTQKISKNPFLGPNYFDKEIEYYLKNYKYHKFQSEKKLIKYIANKIHEGYVVGWFSGRCEFGSRALGNRSILADPTRDGMKDRINQVIKKREGFRPFAPMVIKEKQNIYFDVTNDVPYMNQVVKVKEEYQDKLTAVTHVDGSARIQTVYSGTKIYELLLEFEKLSGFPILLNTSFNIKDKTMVLTPKDAIDTFYDTEIDILIMENYIIKKRRK